MKACDFMKNVCDYVQLSRDYSLALSQISTLPIGVLQEYVSYQGEYYRDVCQVKVLIKEVYGYNFTDEQVDRALRQINASPHAVYSELSWGVYSNLIMRFTEALGLHRDALCASTRKSVTV